MTRLLFIIITLVTVLNGSHFWLSRIGLLNTDAFDVLIEKSNDFKQRSSVYLNQPEKITKQIEAAFKQEHLTYKKELYQHLYNNSALSVFLKSLKYVLYLIFLTLVFYKASRSEKPFELNKVTTLVGAIVLIYSTLSFANFGIAGVIAAFNVYVFLTFLIFSRQNLKQADIKLFALYLLMTLGLLLVLAPIEMSKAIQVFNTNSIFKKRMTGFMDQPNTLGVYVICIAGFFVAMYRSQLNSRSFIALCISALVLIILSGSNAAALVFCVFLTAELVLAKSSNTSSLKPIILLLLGIVIVSLYFTHGRSVVDSLAGRLVKYQYYFSLDLPLLKLLFGHGLGAGTNTIMQIQSYFPFEEFARLPVKFSVDSTPLLLIIQTGVIGCAIFYCLLLYAMIKDIKKRSAYIVFILCSLSINIIEVFPLNIVLALLLSASLMLKAQTNAPET